MSQTAGFNSKLKNWRPLGMSLLTHLFLVLFLILLGYFYSVPSNTQGTLRRVGVVLAVPSENQDAEYLEEADIPQELTDSAEIEKSNPASNPPPALAAELETPDRPELPGVESLRDSDLDANRMTKVPSDANSNSHYQLSEQDLKLIESDQRLLRSRAPAGDPTTISVFGSGGMTGRSFVFVIDRSYSMGNQGLGVIDEAKKQLTAAINQLEPHHTFQIVGYHETTHTMMKRQLLPANDANKQAVPGHISSMSAFGSTNHENGLIAAVAFKPDVIVFMTDGGYPELNNGKLRMIKQLAPRGCEIHCIQFGIGSLQKTTSFMTQLAKQNDGSFRYIDVTKWNKNN
jgi:hypothetical protein